MTQKLSQIVQARVFGQHHACTFACQGCDLNDLSRQEIARVPAFDSLYQFDRADYLQFALWWNCTSREPLLISGEAGCGKTSFVLQFAARTNMPVVQFTARSRMDKTELLGHWSLVNGETRWIPGPAELAWRHGWILLINEVSLAPAEVWVSCNDLFEGAALENPYTNEVIERHPNTRVVLTDNTTCGALDVDAGYFDRNLQDRSVLDRFWHMKMHGLTEKRLQELLIVSVDDALASQFSFEVRAELARRLVKLFQLSRDDSDRSVGLKNIIRVLSLRAIRRAQNIILQMCSVPRFDHEGITNPRFGLTPAAAISFAFTNCLSKNEHDALQAIACTCLGDIENLLRDSHAKIRESVFSKVGDIA